MRCLCQLILKLFFGKGQIPFRYPACEMVRELDSAVEFVLSDAIQFLACPRPALVLVADLGHVFLLSRWPAAGRLSVSVLCFCPAADLIYGCLLYTSPSPRDS